MLSLGFSVDEAFEKFEQARNCSVPDTPEQREWVARLAGSLSYTSRRGTSDV
jgi:hypothetical protein